METPVRTPDLDIVLKDNMSQLDLFAVQEVEAKPKEKIERRSIASDGEQLQMFDTERCLDIKYYCWCRMWDAKGLPILSHHFHQWYEDYDGDSQKAMDAMEKIAQTLMDKGIIGEVALWDMD